MGRSPARSKLVVKHTFLEYVEDAPQKRRSFTEGDVLDSKEHVVQADDANMVQESVYMSMDNAHVPAYHNAPMALQESLAAAAPAMTMMPQLPVPFPSHAWFSVPNHQHVGPGNSQDTVFHQRAQHNTPGNVSCRTPVSQRQGAPFDGRSGTGNMLPQRTSEGPATAWLEQDLHDSTSTFTTVMLRNLPNKYSRDMLVDILDSEGFGGRYTFVYLPIDFKTHAGLGYAFVDLYTAAEARRLREHFEGFTQWRLPSDKVCAVSWSHPGQQGFQEHVERYRNSPVMHDTVPDSWKPALFQAGKRLPFPQPTRKIRAPRIRAFDSD
jgi:hypothetical protein